RLEAAEDGAVPDAGALRDLVDADVEAALGEALARSVEHAVEVPLRVGAKRHALMTGAVRADAWICSTSRRRRTTTRTTSAASTKTAPPANAQWKPCTPRSSRESRARGHRRSAATC